MGPSRPYDAQFPDSPSSRFRDELGADWLQGPYVYSLYREQYELPERMVAVLFVTGFMSAGVTAPLVGVWADQQCVFSHRSSPKSCLLRISIASTMKRAQKTVSCLLYHLSLYLLLRHYPIPPCLIPWTLGGGNIDIHPLLCIRIMASLCCERVDDPFV